MNLTEDMDTDTEAITKAETNCPNCGRSFRDHERMSSGSCEICHEEADAAAAFLNDWEDEWDGIHSSDLCHIRVVC